MKFVQAKLYFIFAAIFMATIAAALAFKDEWKAACSYSGWAMAFMAISSLIPFSRNK